MKRLSEVEIRELEHEEDEAWWIIQERKRAEKEAMRKEWERQERMERDEAEWDDLISKVNGYEADI